MESTKKTSQQRLADLIRQIPEDTKPQAFDHMGSYLEGFMAGAASASKQTKTA